MADGKRAETLILVVDDNVEVLQALRRVLESQQYTVACATSTAEAESLVAKTPPDLIVSDVLLPETDGFAFYEYIRKATTLHDIPFIFLTGNDSIEHRLQAARGGCDEYLLKPVEPEMFLAVVEGKLQRARHFRAMSAQKMQSLHKRIIHTLSHEFRTPLVSIQAGAELLIERMKQQNDPNAALILEAILTGGRRLQRLVEDFMLLQQLDIGDAIDNRTKAQSIAQLGRLVEDTIETFVSQRRLNSHQPTVHFSVVSDEDTDEREVVGDYLADVVLRLLENAYKFGGPSEAIEVTVVLSAPHAEIIIRDHGPGFLEDPEAERVFEPFLQIKRELYEQQGCGVGLTIAQFLAQINGCQLSFSAPKEGAGVAAHIVIPVVEQTSAFPEKVEAATP